MIHNEYSCFFINTIKIIEKQKLIDVENRRKYMLYVTSYRKIDFAYNENYFKVIYISFQRDGCDENTYIQEKKSKMIGANISINSGGVSRTSTVPNVPAMLLPSPGKSASFKIIPQSFTGASIYEFMR